MFHAAKLCAKYVLFLRNNKENTFASLAEHFSIL